MGASFNTQSLGPLHWVAVALAAISGVIHLALGVMFFPGAQPVAFILAGLGFFGAIVLFLREYRRRQLYVAGIGFTALQIVLWLVLNQTAAPSLLRVDPTEAIDKIAQILLIVVLVILLRQE